MKFQFLRASCAAVAETFKSKWFIVLLALLAVPPIIIYSVYQFVTFASYLVTVIVALLSVIVVYKCCDVFDKKNVFSKTSRSPHHQPSSSHPTDLEDNEREEQELSNLYSSQSHSTLHGTNHNTTNYRKRDSLDIPVSPTSPTSSSTSSGRTITATRVNQQHRSSREGINIDADGNHLYSNNQKYEHSHYPNYHLNQTYYPVNNSTSGYVGGERPYDGGGSGSAFHRVYPTTSSKSIYGPNVDHYGSTSLDSPSSSGSTMAYKRRSRPSLVRSDAITSEMFPLYENYQYVSPTHSHSSDYGDRYGPYGHHAYSAWAYHQPLSHPPSSSSYGYQHYGYRRPPPFGSNGSSNNKNSQSCSSESGSIEDDPIAPYMMWQQRGQHAPSMHQYNYSHHVPFSNQHYPHRGSISSTPGRRMGHMRPPSRTETERIIPEEWTPYASAEDQEEIQEVLVEKTGGDIVDQQRQQETEVHVQNQKSPSASSSSNHHHQPSINHQPQEDQTKRQDVTNPLPMRRPSSGPARFHYHPRGHHLVRQSSSFDRETNASVTGTVDDGPLSETTETSIRSLSRQTTFSSTKEQDIAALHSALTSTDRRNSTVVSASNVVVVGQSSSSRPSIGFLDLSHAYDAPSKKLVIELLSAEELTFPGRENVSNILIKITVLGPGGKKHKIKTKSKSIDGEERRVTFSTTDKYVFTRISPEEVSLLVCRFRVYSSEKTSKMSPSVYHLLGEGVLSLSRHKPLQTETKIRLTLEARSTHYSRSNSRNSDISSSGGMSKSDSMTSGSGGGFRKSPELLIGLSYNGTTGRLSVSVIKGSLLRSPSSFRPPDCYVKLTIVSSTGQEIARSKTSTRKGQPNPIFKESFIFQVS